MIEGKVTARLEACIQIAVELPDGNVADVLAVVDTGFSGKLVLPKSFLDDYGFPVIGMRPVMMADGTIVDWPRYDAILHWHDARRHVDVLASEGEILVGMELLRGSQLLMDIVEAGRVAIQPLN